MNEQRIYPDEPAGPFPTPPATVTDREGREIAIRAHEGSDEGLDALVAMYDDFDPADRAQGIPPTGEDRIRSWLERVLGDDCHNLVAWHGEAAAGHATLVPDGDAYELAIFVHQRYQEAGVGTALLKHLLGYGDERGVERVWLTVERWNKPAVALYRKVGFETSDAESFELEMSLLLGDMG